jgi:hypothetical protein
MYRSGVARASSAGVLVVEFGQRVAYGHGAATGDVGLAGGEVFENSEMLRDHEILDSLGIQGNDGCHQYTALGDQRAAFGARDVLDDAAGGARELADAEGGHAFIVRRLVLRRGDGVLLDVDAGASRLGDRLAVLGDDLKVALHRLAHVGRSRGHGRASAHTAGQVR